MVKFKGIKVSRKIFYPMRTDLTVYTALSIFLIIFNVCNYSGAPHLCSFRPSRITLVCFEVPVSEVRDSEINKYGALLNSYTTGLKVVSRPTWIVTKNVDDIMNKVTLGVLLCLSALILLHKNHAMIGIPVFIAGIILMNAGRWGKR